VPVLPSTALAAVRVPFSSDDAVAGWFCDRRPLLVAEGVALTSAESADEPALLVARIL
jgi:hypothetical protein